MFCYVLHEKMKSYLSTCIFNPILVSLLKRIDDLEVPELGSGETESKSVEIRRSPAYCD